MLAVGSAVPLFYLPLAFNIRLMIVIAVSVPLGVFGVVGIGGDSLTQFVAHWFRFMLKQPNCPFVLYVGSKKLVKRKEFEAYISSKLII